MEFARDLSSKNQDISKTPLSKKERISPIYQTEKPLELKIDPHLNIQDSSYELAQGLESNLTSRDVQEWKDTLKSYLPKELQSGVENITMKDIAQMIALIIGTGLLIASGVGIGVAIGSVGARLGVGTMIMRIGTTIMNSPNTSSVIMGLVPGMKNAAPNQALAFGVSEMKNVILYIIPGMVSTRLSNIKK